jgi:uncharacterized protein (UPF0216 family)
MRKRRTLKELLDEKVSIVEEDEIKMKKGELEELERQLKYIC